MSIIPEAKLGSIGMRKLIAVGCAFSSVLSGCATFTPRQIAEPSSISLQEGVEDVADAIAYLQTIPREERAGLLLDEVEIKFNVAAGATAKNNGKLTVTNTIPSGGSIGLEAGTELTNTGDRGNVITLKFKNLATADITKGAFANGKTISVPRGPTLSSDGLRQRIAARRSARQIRDTGTPRPTSAEQQTLDEMQAARQPVEKGIGDSRVLSVRTPLPLWLGETLGPPPQESE